MLWMGITGTAYAANYGQMLYGSTTYPYNTYFSTGSNGTCLTSNGTIPVWGSCGGGSLSGGTTNWLTYWTSPTTVSATSSPVVGYITATTTSSSTLPTLSSSNFFTNAIALGASAINYIQSLFTGGTGISVSGGTITNTGVTSAVAGTGIGVSGATGAVTITNNGVTSLGGVTGAIATSSLGLQNKIALTTSGSSGASTFDGTTLNIPSYTGGSGSGVPSTTPFTSGYIPYATSSLALTNSNLFQLGGNVGIGTVSPAAKLDVAGNEYLDVMNSTITGNKILTIGSTGGTYGPTSLTLENESGANGPVFSTLGSSVNLIDFGFIPGSGAQQNIRLEARSGNTFGTGNSAGEFQIGTADNPDIVIGTGTTAIKRGNVGIGTTSPATALDVNGDITDENVKSAACLATDSTGKIVSTTCGTGTGGLATSSPWTVGNLAYVSSQGAVSSVGTSTLSASSPLTGSFTQVGSGGALGIQVANTSQGGYLSNTDWNTFNGKQATIGVTWPITLTGATVGFSGLATSSPWTVGNLARVSSSGTIGSVATGTETCSGNVSCTPFSVVGTGGAITGSGGTNYWTLSGNSLYPNSTSYNVGIGTISPTGLLDTSYANTSATMSAANAAFTLDNTSSIGQTEVVFRTNGTVLGGIRPDFAGNFNWYATGSQGHQFYCSLSATPCGSIGSNGLLVGNTANGAVATNNLDDLGNANIGYTLGTAAPSHGLIVNGNVGIGTTTPATALDIVGTTTIEAARTHVNDLVCYMANGALGHMTQTAGLVSGTCLAN